MTTTTADPASRAEPSLAAPGEVDSARLSALEDLEARSGSAAALLRTIVGSVLRPLGGWMSSAGAVDLLAALDVPATTARSSLTRITARGVLVRETRGGATGYALSAAAAPMLDRGDRRIFADRTPPASASWCLLSYSIPERHRDRRARLRRRLETLGCGTVSDGLWIAPAALADDLREAVDALAAPGEVQLFTDARPTAADLPTLIAGWYDVPRMRAAHTAFIARFGDAPAPADDRAAFARWMRVLDEWRVIPYLDPVLPAAALPADWPGAASAALFADLRASLAPRALAHARSVAR
ncbi:PaaX family transcriptional regulator C-terminal domain-containing protein [Leifsonia sp. NPDC058292]|uniref:PaaX family transcriptional regulator n=1 Tax=Leifsonia sp. NPDC058292 TaxID=3346428 RepID=UPI0036D90018